MRKIAIEMSQDLRRAFKATCAMNNVSMRDALVEQANLILEMDETCYNTHRPKMGKEMCVLCLNVEEEFLDNIKERKKHTGDKIRDIYITAIINYLTEHQQDYDYSQDIDEV